VKIWRQVGSLRSSEFGIFPQFFDNLRGDEITNSRPGNVAKVRSDEMCFWRTRENSELRLVEQPSTFVQRTPRSTYYEIRSSHTSFRCRDFRERPQTKHSPLPTGSEFFQGIKKVKGPKAPKQPNRDDYKEPMHSRQ
jgi:hypothetical protein